MFGGDSDGGGSIPFLDITRMLISPTPPPPRSSPSRSYTFQTTTTFFYSSPELNNPNPNPPFSRHHRSLSADDDDDDDASGGGGGVRAHRRWHSFSVDESAHGLFDVDSGMDGVKKAMGPEKLAHLSLIDPKKAKRILANRKRQHFLLKLQVTLFQVEFQTA